MKKHFLLLKICIFTCIATSCFITTEKIFAAEVDSFTNRHVLSDSTSELNKIVNLWLNEAVSEANQKSTLRTDQLDDLNQLIEEYEVDYCNQTLLFDSLKNKFARFLVGQLETYVNESIDLDTTKVKFNESIYRDFTFAETPTISFKEKLAAVIRIGDWYIGTDKFGHFFTEGRTYFEIASIVDQNSALQFGELSENILYGEWTTGVYSYADLAANFNGLRFWNRILAEKPGPLFPDRIKTPYVNCVNKQWKVTTKFDWRDYVDPAWDEAINCSAFRNAVLLEKVNNQIEIATNGKSCPLLNVEPKELQVKYGELVNHLFNPDGNKVLPQPLKPKFDVLWSNMFDRFN